VAPFRCKIRMKLSLRRRPIRRNAISISVRNHTYYMHSGPTMRLRLRLNGPFGTKAVGPILQKALP
jgi:hypothetical protein